MRFISMFIGCTILFFSAFASANGENYVLVPKGKYAEIDVKLMQDALKSLTQGTVTEKEKAIAAILLTSDKYAPPVFYVLSNVLYTQGKVEEAEFWFYAGQLRARFDANRCSDISAREAVAVLNQKYGPSINKYAFAHISTLRPIVLRVIEWDRNTPHNYDQRWINLHGMGAVLTSLDDTAPREDMSLPRDEWDSIAEKTRADYLKGFEEAMSIFQKPGSQLGNHL